MQAAASSTTHPPPPLIILLQVLESLQAAGTAPHMLYARIDAPRFSKIYSSKGRWGLLDQLLVAPKTTSSIVSLEPAAATPAAPLKASSSGRPAMPLQQVVQAVKQAAADILGEQLGDGDSFPAGGLDSLSAVELASSLGRSLGLDLPGTLVFDYPSVSAMAQHIHSLLAPAQTAGGSAAGALVPAAPAALVTASDAAPAGTMLISLAVAARLPTGYGESVLGGADCISLVPFGRWDLEALRVSSCAGTAGAVRPSNGHSCMAACQFNAAIWVPAS